LASFLQTHRGCNRKTVESVYTLLERTWET